MASVACCGVSRSRAQERKSDKIAANAKIAGSAKTAKERLVVSEHESEEENGSYSWLRFRDDLAALLCLPFAISLGLHIAMLAAIFHSRFRIPYYLGRLCCSDWRDASPCNGWNICR